MLAVPTISVTMLLLGAIVIVSGFALFGNPLLIERWGFQPARAFKESHRWITGGFVHVSLTHLLFNAITLYFFGPLLEAQLGGVNYLVLYLGSLFCAHALTYIQHRGNSGYSAVGASGAISGILFAYVLFAPFNLIYFFGILPVPAIVFAFLFVGGSIYAIKTNRIMGIAHEAHLGGALGGVILTILLEPRVLPSFLEKFL